KGKVSEGLDPAHWAKNDHYEYAYFPYTDECYMFFRNRTDKRRTTNALTNWFHRDFIENDLAGLLLGITALDPKAAKTVMRDFAAAIPKMHEVDRCDRIMTIPRKHRAYLMEFAIPIANVGAV